ncbi:MAG: CinA family nicotinamide mononucleotide deamidase-related protein [Planctomycetota bacterium]
MAAPAVALLHVGDELLAGRVVNTGGAVLSRVLEGAGFRVVAMETAGDRQDAVVDALRRLVARADAVVVTGGLGPTPDDMTREALADACGRGLVTDPGLLEEVVRRTRGLAPEANEKQAAIPEGAVAFRNPVGVAAALRVEIDGRPVYALPGVPVEMEALLYDALLPDLQAAFPDVRAPERASVSACGMAEAVLVERLGDLLGREGEPEVGVTVRDGIITVIASGPGAAQRSREIREALGDDVCGAGNRTLPETVLDLLQARGARLAVAESLTGGMLASSIVDVPGASAVLAGGVVAYTADMKHNLLGVPLEVIEAEGVVSATVARAMARGARERLGAEYAVATTGAAGPDPDDGGAPPGTGFVAVAGPDGREEAREVRCVGDRNAVRRRFCNAALDLVRRIVPLG